MTESLPSRPASFVAQEGMENAAWERIEGTWALLHGGFLSHGVSIEWHDFRTDEDLDWGRSFHEHSIEVCLNFSGQALMRSERQDYEIGPNQLAIYAAATPEDATRAASSTHRFATFEMSGAYLRHQFAAVMGGLKPAVQEFLDDPKKPVRLLEVAGIPANLLGLRMQLLEPGVPPLAHATWCQSKILDVLAQVLFRPEQQAELFCERHKRVNRDRVQRVLFLLDRDSENPPTLEMLAAEVDCSPFYLSRLFAQEVGSSIPRYIRTKRIEKAAELLRAGERTVLEVALAVGYSSVSAFNKAFAEQMGCAPGLYPEVKAGKRQG